VLEFAKMLVKTHVQWCYLQWIVETIHNPWFKYFHDEKGESYIGTNLVDKLAFGKFISKLIVDNNKLKVDISIVSKSIRNKLIDVIESTFGQLIG
jgi:hypothetical protein